MTSPLRSSCRAFGISLALVLLSGCMKSSPSRPVVSDGPGGGSGSGGSGGGGGSGGPLSGGAVATPIPGTGLDGNPITLRGRVLDMNNQPLRAARVKVTGGSADYVLTDGAGQFVVYTENPLPLTIAAGKDGYFNSWNIAADTVTPTTIQLLATPTGDNVNYQFLTATTCSFCHGNDYADWLSSNMSKSGINAWVHDVHNGGGTPGGTGGFVYRRDSTHRTYSPTGDCANCHQPVRSARNPGRTDMAPVTDPEAQEGVNCDVCHKVRDLDLTYKRWPGVAPEKVKFTRTSDGYGEPLIYGPRPDATFSASPMEPAFNSLHEDGSRLCAACHEDANDVDQNGRFDDPGDIPSELSYSEWVGSPYSVRGPGFKSCADCHMDNPTNRSRLCNFQSTLRDPATVHGHRFEGTTPSKIRSAVTFDATFTLRPTRVVRVDVDLLNSGAGHYFPTGVHIRNVILKVEVSQNGTPLTQVSGETIDDIAGVGDPRQGNFATLPGKVYTRIYVDRQGNPGVFYTEATGLKTDTRLPPLYRDTPRFEFVAPQAGPVDVRVVLLYRRAYRHFVVSKNWTTDGHGNPLPDVQGPDFGLKVAEKIGVVQVP